ncbi:4-alpha-glucanotransferase [Kitasatospora sp. SUK 42]|uniref:4-alpha-glucanotransferase n=1 Tax=Kitasatospora sp. SUK 42 TaxID=1588882 RepID=UPI0018CAF64F|nr:4-alpha-glucanotransferase [Kitasatospora sp. SUK 42]MBV2151513.1 4-alpha-glucanotransferase [Kitasatospora sp. SUK 42]
MQVPVQDAPPPPAELVALAQACGVDTRHPGPGGQAVGARTLVAVLAALGVVAGTPEQVREALERHRAEQRARLLPPCVVVRQGRRTALDVPADARLHVELEGGGSWELPCGHSHWLPADLPLGRHTLRADTSAGKAQAVLIVAPRKLPQLPGRSWGFLAQLYSVLSERSWGMGDLGDLAELAQWAGAGLGAGFVQINPLHQALPADPSDPSPYRPSSRRFADPVHLRIEAVPEYAYLEGNRRDQAEELTRRAARLRGEVLGHDGLIDRDAVWRLKREALELLHEVPRGPGGEAEYEAYQRREGEWLRRHALWNALAEVHGADWHHWPKGLRHPSGPQIEQAAKELADRVEFHRWLAWQVDRQLAHAQRSAREAGMPVGLIHDLAVGAHPDGADAWALQDVLAGGISVGAPPDAFNAHGQDWGLPPWRPDALAAAGYAPYAELLRAAARHAGALRIDHVMGLFRLWWVPAGHPPTEGAYVRYDAEAMLGVLALEAHRAGTAVIGEDLGTVEPGVREELAERGVLGTSVLWFERDWRSGGGILPPERWRPDCLATLTTHDLPSTAARLSGEHVELRHRLGLLARPLGEEQAEAAGELADWRAELDRLGLLTPGEPLSMPVLYRFLRATPAELVGVWLPDLVGDPRPQNLPGTWDQYPNWRLPIADGAGDPVTLERLATAPAARLLAHLLAPPSPRNPSH